MNIWKCLSGLVCCESNWPSSLSLSCMSWNCARGTSIVLPIGALMTRITSSPSSDDSYSDPFYLWIWSVSEFLPFKMSSSAFSLSFCSRSYRLRAFFCTYFYLYTSIRSSFVTQPNSSYDLSCLRSSAIFLILLKQVSRSLLAFSCSSKMAVWTASSFLNSCSYFSSSSCSSFWVFMSCSIFY